jgi:hypothetical protein
MSIIPILLVLHFVVSSLADFIGCSVKEEWRWHDPWFSDFKGEEFTPYSVCYFDSDSVTSVPVVKFSNVRNENVTEIEGREMKSFEYLPVDISETFPNLTDQLR